MGVYTKAIVAALLTAIEIIAMLTGIEVQADEGMLTALVEGFGMNRETIMTLASLATPFLVFALPNRA